MTKLNIHEKLKNRKGKKASRFMYFVFRNVFVRPFLARPMHVHVIDNVPGGIKSEKRPFILMSNHSSRCDYMYTCLAVKPHALNYVASYTEFFRSHLHLPFSILNVVPKKNFVPDVHCIKEMMQVVKDGGNLALFAEGKCSISGTNQPIMMGTGKLLKHLKVPVYTSVIRGAYLSHTQWNIANRPGKIEITVEKFMDVDEIMATSDEEIEQKLNTALWNDDFEWNKVQRVKYKGNDTVAVKLEEHLFRCPRCGAEFQNHGEKNVFRCKNCGNGVQIDEYYDLHPLDETCVVPKSLRVWYELQRRAVYREVRDNPNFTMQDEFILGGQPSDHYVKGKKISSEPIGKCTLTLTRNTLSFVGTLNNGEHIEKSVDILNVPSVVFETDSSYFGTYAFGDYYEFTGLRPVCTKWQIAVEECHRLAGGKWVNPIPQQQWIYEDDKPDDKENYFL